MTREVTLSVNDTPIACDYFVQGFIDHTLAGMLEALEGTSPVKSLDLAIESNNTKIILNGAALPINAFVARIIKNTVSGLVSSLKGVNEINKLNIKVKR